ncbi:MAG: DUF3320 domain-containing protein, partial [Nitrospirota bacterium]|nr:DUF3320 domain-containing protein [Nitrospirota bacterium]
MSGVVGEVESPFEEEVVRLIKSWGYDAVPQVGAAGYRVDIGVRHPDHPGSYMLGVECDGAAYHSAKTARDRDRLRESVLRGLGWRIHRIWGISWYRDRLTQEDRLRKALDDAIQLETPSPAESLLSTVEDEPELDFHPVDLAAAPDWAVPYVKSIPPRRGGWSDPGARDTVPELIRFCEYVVPLEAPLHIETLYRRLRESWGVGSVGSRIRENVRIALSMTKVNGSKVTVDTEKFIRLASQPTVSVRKPDAFDEPRKAGMIPPEELDQAIKLVLTDSVSATEEQLRVTVRNVFG